MSVCVLRVNVCACGKGGACAFVLSLSIPVIDHITKYQAISYLKSLHAGKLQSSDALYRDPQISYVMRIL